MIILAVFIFVFGLSFSFLFFYRNAWVYKKRSDLIVNEWQKYKKLESYDSMFFKFWIWDIDKFVIEDKDS